MPFFTILLVFLKENIDGTVSVEVIGLLTEAEHFAGSLLLGFRDIILRILLRIRLLSTFRLIPQQSPILIKSDTPYANEADSKETTRNE